MSLVHRRDLFDDDASGAGAAGEGGEAKAGAAGDAAAAATGGGSKGGSPKPCLLYGYGSYGISIDPGFDAKILPYLDRGMIYCIAHIRGGGEMGQPWYEEQGKYLNKRNTFSDFICAAEYLVDQGLSSPDQIAIEGRSAGGLLVGNVVNMRPDLFRAAVAGVPFVDLMNTMCDPSIPLTTGEWEEWGNPNEHKYVWRRRWRRRREGGMKWREMEREMESVRWRERRRGTENYSASIAPGVGGVDGVKRVGVGR
jgi:hypothetical protein